MDDLLAILYAVLDTEYWTINDIVKWSDNVILKTDIPQHWLINLSLSQTVHEAELAISEANNEFSNRFSDNIDELLIGLHIKMFENGDISYNKLKFNIFQTEECYCSRSYFGEDVVGILQNQKNYIIHKKLAEKALLIFEDIQIEKHRNILEI